jgi:hypothetical protein
MKKLILLSLLFCFSISNAQKSKKNKTIKGNEKEVTVSRTTPEYDKIEVGGSFDVKLISGKEGSITIKGDENLVELLKTEVVNGTLKVGFERGKMIQFNYKSAIEITIPFEQINELSFSGSGNFFGKDIITAENLEVEIAGSGNVKLELNTTNTKIERSGSGNLNIKGKTQNLEIESTGSGNANASELIAENVVASQIGSGNIKVNCTKKLVARSSGSGSIIYNGNPEKVDKSSSGSGSISGH